MSSMSIPMPVETKERPIAVFDSGLGGISVLRALVRLMPHERFLYFGDSANAPYGSRPPEEIRELTLRHGQRLLQEAKALVIACNTATSVAAQELRQIYPERIIVGIEPALKPAIEQFQNGTIAVMATETTLRERKFAELIEQYGKTAKIVKCPCPELVEFVERGEFCSQAVTQAIEHRLGGSYDAVVLGCTHFPFLKEALRSVVGETTVIFDGAEGTAKETHRRLVQADLLNSAGGSVELTNSMETKLELSKTLLYVQ